MRIFLPTLFLLTIFVIAFIPALDTDFGWHYRCGHELLTQSKPCTQNTFSYFLSDYKAFNPSFLYDVVLAFTYDHFGFNGVSFLGAFIIALCGFIFIKIASGDLLVKGTVFIALYFLSSVVFDLGLRSQLITYLFLLVLLLLLKKAAEGKGKYLLAVPLLFLVWVNSHIGFFIGIPVLAAYGLNEILKVGLQKKKTVYLLGISIVSVLITFVNPFGHRVYVEVIRHATSPLGSLIAEWVPPDGMTKLIIVTVTFLTLGLSAYRRKANIPYLLLLILFSFLAFTARRNIPLFGTIAALSLLDIIPLKNLRLPNEITIPLLLAAAIGITVIRIPHTLTTHMWNNYCNSRITHYPCALLQKYPHLNGNIFTNYEWGGFLLWQRPKSRVFIDGRMSAWRDKKGVNPYSTYLSIIQTQQGWDTILRDTKTDYILISPNTFLDLLLKEQGPVYGWKQLYSDPSTVLYEKAFH